MKKFICLILVLSFLVSSVVAADVYEVEADTKVSLMSSAYDVMPLDITSSDLNTYLGTSSPLYTLFHSYHTQSTSFLYYLKDFFEDYFGYSTSSSSDSIAKDFDTLIAIMRDVGGMLSTGLYNETSSSVTPSPFYVLNRYYLNESGGQSTATNGIFLAELVRNGFLGLKAVIENQTQYDYSTVLSNILTAVNTVNASVDTVNTSVGKVNTSVGQVNTSVGQVNTSVGAVNSSVQALSPVITALGPFITTPLISTRTRYLNNEGTVTYGSSSLSLSDVAADGFLGLRNYLTVDAGNYFMGSDGTITSLTFPYPVVNFLASFSRGVQALLSGEQSDNRYSVELTDNSLVSSSVSKRGLGPMLSAYLDSVENHTALLSYVFASPKDLELKMESESNMDAVGDTILSSDSKSSVKVKDISDISSASDSIQELGETGVTPGLAFDQLIDGSQFGFFSQEVFDDLHTVPQTFSRDSSTQIVTNFYEQSREEFYSMIGKG